MLHIFHCTYQEVYETVGYTPVHLEKSTPSKSTAPLSAGSRVHLSTPSKMGLTAVSIVILKLV